MNIPHSCPRPVRRNAGRLKFFSTLIFLLFLALTIMNSCTVEIPYFGEIFGEDLVVDLKPDEYEGTDVVFHVIVKNSCDEVVKGLSGYIESGGEVIQLELPENMGYGIKIVEVDFEEVGDEVMVEVFGMIDKRRVHSKDVSKRR